jgi:thiamine biosynthesis protein ThiS
MEILVNGEAREVPPGTTVERLLELLALRARRIAVAVNRTVVPRSDFGRHAVAAGDRVEILEAAGGG